MFVCLHPNTRITLLVPPFLHLNAHPLQSSSFRHHHFLAFGYIILAVNLSPPAYLIKSNTFTMLLTHFHTHDPCIHLCKTLIYRSKCHCDIMHPCLNPTFTLNIFLSPMSTLTQDSHPLWKLFTNLNVWPTFYVIYIHNLPHTLSINSVIYFLQIHKGQLQIPFPRNEDIGYIMRDEVKAKRALKAIQRNKMMSAKVKKGIYVIIVCGQFHIRM